MRKQTPLPRRVIGALLMVLLTGCQTWRPTAYSPQTLIPVEQPSSVRVTLMNGETITVRDPWMRNDSILGNSDAGPVTVAARDVRSLEVQRSSSGKSIGVGLLVAGVGAVIGAVIVGNAVSSSFGN